MKAISSATVMMAALLAVGVAYGDEEAADANAAFERRIEMPPPEVMFKMMDAPQAALLFEEGLSNAIYEEGGWAFDDDVLVALGKGDIWTKERYGNFILHLEFKCVADTNSGVFIRCGDLDDWMHTCMEVQILQNNEDYENPKWHCGAIFDCLEPVQQSVREPGEWNTYLIIAKDNILWVFLNNDLVNYMDLDLWTEPGKNPDGTDNKFRDAYKDMPREGHIGLQYHGQDIRFRNVRLESLD